MFKLFDVSNNLSTYVHLNKQLIKHKNKTNKKIKGKEKLKTFPTFNIARCA